MLNIILIKMKKLKDQVPESLVGVFGIDFMGKVVGRIMVPVYMVIFVIGITLSYFGADYLPTTEIDFNGGPLMITPIPLIVAIYLAKLFSNIYERVVTSVKVVYFTIFYTKITHPESIMEELQGELTNYLKLDGLNTVDNLDQQEVKEMEAV
jgi:hypothetical protein